MVVCRDVVIIIFLYFCEITMKYELQNLIQGKGGDGKTNIISTISSYLNGCKEASNNNKGKEYTKQQEG